MSKKILVVDDAAVERDKLKSILTAKGYSVITAEDGNSGIDLVNSEKPDLVFLDVVMPGKSGFEICRSIKKNADTKDIPVVMVTSKSQKADKVMGEMQGASGHISKPYSDQEVLDYVANMA